MSADLFSGPPLSRSSGDEFTAPLGSNRAGSTESRSSLSTNKQVFHAYTVAALVIGIVLYLIARNEYEDVHAWARLPSWIANPMVLLFVTVAVLVAAALATTKVSQLETANILGVRMAVGSLFLLIGVLFVVVALLIYQSRNFTAAFWLSLLALVLTVAHAVATFKASRGAAALVYPLIVYLLVAVYYTWHLHTGSSDCMISCCEHVGEVYA